MFSKNREVVDALMDLLGQRKSPTLRTQALRALNLALTNLEKQSFLPWFLARQDTPAVPAKATTITISNDFLREVEDRRPRLLYRDVEERLTRKPYDEIRSQALAGYSFDRRYYDYIQNSEREVQIYLYPSLEEDAALQVFFYEKSSPLIDDNQTPTNPWVLEAPLVLLYRAGHDATRYLLHNEKKSKMFFEDYVVAIRELENFHEARLHTNLDYGSGDFGLAEDGVY